MFGELLLKPGHSRQVVKYQTHHPFHPSLYPFSPFVLMLFSLKQTVDTLQSLGMVSLLKKIFEELLGSIKTDRFDDIIVSNSFLLDQKLC